jgi:hypothetical protein
MTTVFGARTASQTFFPAKGFVQSSPFVNITTMGGARTSANWQTQLQYPGTAHPVNSPFDFSFRAVAPFDSLLPNADAASQWAASNLSPEAQQKASEAPRWDFGGGGPPFGGPPR